MEFNYKEHLLLQAIFPNYGTQFVVTESYQGTKPLSAIFEELVLSEYRKQ